MQILSQFIGRDDVEDVDHDAEEARLEKRRIQKLFANGPTKLKFPSNGQLRRAEARSVKSQARKANRRYRRDWMRKQQHIATLRGQVSAANLDTPLGENARKGLLNGFGERDERGRLVATDAAAKARAVELGREMLAAVDRRVAA